MKVLIFGTGKYYLQYKKYLADTEILALIDNDRKKQGTKLDDCRIIAPENISEYSYDKIYIVSSYVVEMRRQLLKMGISGDKIAHIFDLPDSIAKPYQIYHPDEIKAGSKACGRKIVMISHDLSVTGAQNCLLLAAQVYIRYGYSVVVASPWDGSMRGQFLSAGADVVIDECLQTGRIKNLAWMAGADLLFINTVSIYYLLFGRDTSLPVVWWLHEPEFLYKSVIPDLLQSIPADNMRIFTVSEVADNAFHKVYPSFPTRNLMFGLPDGISREDTAPVLKQSHGPVRFVAVGGVDYLKGQDILVGAVSKLTEYEKLAGEFLLVGDMDTEFAVSQIEKSRSLNLPVRFCGLLSHEKTLHMIQKADVLICCSRQETVSMAVIEAMMYSVPAVVTDAAGIVNYITNRKNGLLFASENMEDLKEKIKYCLEHREELRVMGRQARKVYEEHFSMKTFSARLMEIVRETVK